MSISAHVRVAAAARRVSPDLFHYPHFNLPVVTPARSVVTIHDVFPLVDRRYFGRGPRLKSLLFRAATAHAAARATAVIVPSGTSRDALAREFAWAAGKVRVVPEGVDEALAVRPDDAAIEAFRSRHGLDRPYACYVGVSRPRKNLPRLLDAFARIAADLPHLLVLAGQPIGDVTDLRAHADALGLGGRVRWLGYLTEADLACLYAGADAFALCSLWEGFGLGVIEAMALGTPVVCSDVGAPAEVAGDAALRVDPTSADAIAAGLFRMCTEPGTRARFREAGLARSRTFTWERAASLTAQVYREALEER